MPLQMPPQLGSAPPSQTTKENKVLHRTEILQVFSACVFMQAERKISLIISQPPFQVFLNSEEEELNIMWAACS